MSTENLTYDFSGTTEPKSLLVDRKSFLVAGVHSSWKKSLVAVFILLVGSYLFRKIRSYYRLRKFNGPWLAGWSRFWILRTVLSGNMNSIFYDVSKKYGPIARVGPNSLIISDATLWRRICAVRSPYVRSDWYKGMRFEPDKDVILTYRTEKHQEMRHKMAAGYAGKENEDLEGNMNGRITALLDLIGQKYLSSSESGYNPLDFGLWSSNLTFDVITQLGFSHCVQNVENNTDVLDYYGSIAEGLPFNCAFTVFPGIITFLEKSGLGPWIIPSKEDKTGYGQLLGFAHARAAERFGPKKVVRNDMLGSFLKHGITYEEAKSETIVQMMAGTDLAATVLRVAVLYIATNPPVHEALMTEIRAHNHFHKVPTTDIISLAAAKSMPYLQACIKESLRIFPPFCGLLEKTTPAGGDTLPNGQYVPEGTRIGFSFWGAMRDISVFGEDADVFRPERWLEAHGTSSSQLSLMEKSLECVFSPGRYTCLGKDLAILQVNKIIIEFFRRFDISIADPLKPWESYAYGIFLQRHFWLKLSARKF